MGLQRREQESNLQPTISGHSGSSRADSPVSVTALVQA